jgi:DNA-binding transcriptional regulator YiaG
MYHYTDGGLRNVWLRNGYELVDTPYGKAVSFRDGDGLIRAVCLALTRKVGRLTGVEFRYIRSSGFLMSQPSLAKLLGVDGQTVARWEKSGKVPKWADKLARLLYAAHADGNETIQSVVARINDVDRLVNQSITLEATSAGWEAVASELAEAA